MSSYQIGVLDVAELTALSSLRIEKEHDLIERYEAKYFTFPNGVRVVSENVMDYILTIVKKERDIAISELLKAQGLKAQNTKLKNRVEILKKENEALKQNIKEYDKTYGKYISPFTIIEELYRDKSLAYLILVRREKFKIKVSQKQFNYWIGIFIDIGIVRRIDKSNMQSLRSYTEAHDILYQNEAMWKGHKVEKEIGEIVDTTTAGGENLSEEEKEEITKEVEKEFTDGK